MLFQNSIVTECDQLNELDEKTSQKNIKGTYHKSILPLQVAIVNGTLLAGLYCTFSSTTFCCAIKNIFLTIIHLQSCSYCSKELAAGGESNIAFKWRLLITAGALKSYE